MGLYDHEYILVEEWILQLHNQPIIFQEIIQIRTSSFFLLFFWFSFECVLITVYTN